MSSANEVHPSPGRLAAFRQGKLEPADWTAIERHLVECRACDELLKSLPDDFPVETIIDLEPQPAGAATLGPKTEALPPDSIPEIPSELTAHPRYQILELLGVGGMGAVYKARHRLMERTVALKVITRKLTEDADAVGRFQREVKAAARLSHPNIVTAYDAEQAGSLHYLVMEFVAGTSLGRVIDEGGPLPVAMACDYVRQAARGLQHAHERGMVHRDIKPGNLMLTAGGNIKILDFGLARFARGDGSGVSLTQSNIAMGTPDYIAPEQALNARTADIRADIYSLGCTLYHLLTGSVPFPGGTVFDKLVSHTEASPRALASLRPDVPADLERIVQRMMAKEPAERYQTPAEVAEALTPFAESSRAAAATLPALNAARPPTLPTTTSFPDAGPRRNRSTVGVTAEPQSAEPQRRRSIVAFTACALIAVACVAVGGYHFFFRSGPVRDAGSAERQAGNPDTGSPPSVGEVRGLEGHSRFAPWVAFLPGGRQAVSGGRDRTIRLWDVETGKEVAQLGAHQAPVSCLAVSADGRRALSGAAGVVVRDGKRVGYGGVRLWDLEAKRQLRFGPGVRGQVFCVALSRNGQRALVAGNEHEVHLYDLGTGQQIHSFVGHNGPITSVHFLPGDARALTASADGTIRLWNLETGAELRRYTGHSNGVRCLALSADGREFVSGGADGTVRLWSVEEPRPRRTLTAHDKPVTCVAFLPDSRRALSGSLDRTVRLWDLSNGGRLYEIEGLGYPIESLSVSPDGRRVLIGGQNAIIRLWRLPPPAADR